MDGFFNFIVALTAVIGIGLTFKVIRMQRQANKDQTFLRLHEILMGDEMRVGRGLLIEAGKPGERLPEFNSKPHRQMTHALGGFETAGIYIDHGLMSRERFIAGWHHHLRAMRVAADLMAKQRVEDRGSWWPWPHLWRLFEAADAFDDDKLICCRNPGAGLPGL